jgi:hypothetical protein
MPFAMKPIPLGATAPGTRRSRWLRRLAAVALSILVILAIAWSGYWLFLTSQLEAGVQQWIAERREQGYEIGYTAIRSGGFPRWAQIVLTKPAMAMPANAAPLAWWANRLIVGVDPFQPRRLYIDGSGAHALSIGSGADQVRTHVEAGHLRLAQEIGEAAPASVLTLRDLVLRPLGGDGSGPGPELREALTIARLDASGGSDRFVVNAAEIAFPGRPDLPLGSVVESLAAEATVQGKLALLPWPQALFRWRDEGGVIDVAALKAVHGPLALSGSGTVALDEAGQPVGAFAAQVMGLFQAIDALQARGYMGRGQALAAKLALGVLTGRTDRRGPPDRLGPPGGHGPLNLPLTLQDRVLSVGPVELVQIPEVIWLPATAARHP